MTDEQAKADAVSINKEYAPYFPLVELKGNWIDPQRIVAIERSASPYCYLSLDGRHERLQIQMTADEVVAKLKEKLK